MSIIKKIFLLVLGVGIGIFAVSRGLLIVYASGVDVELPSYPENSSQNKTYEEFSFNSINELVNTDDIYANSSGSTEYEKKISELQKKKMAKENQIMSDVAKVQKVYKKYDAPLYNSSEHLVRTAMKYNVDYKLVVAISIVESGGGKNCFKAYNPFGWGQRDYSSFNDAIDTMIEGLATDYYAQGLDTLEEIAPVYGPISPETWIPKIQRVMALME